VTTVDQACLVNSVFVVIRHNLARHGVEAMLHSIPEVRSVVTLDEPGKLDGVEFDDRDTVIIKLDDIDENAKRALRAATAAGCRVLVLVDGVDLRRLSMLAGVHADGFLEVGDLGTEFLRTALLQANRSELLMPRDLVTLLSAAARDAVAEPNSQVRVRVTTREQQVLILLVEGMSNKQIARRLRISEYGAKRHVANILAKLDCPNRTLAVAKALRFGLCAELASSAG
jgi:two-component system, NarL family, nitrate/nitrite response regulator NarL